MPPQPSTLLTLPAPLISHSHSLLAATAFLGALALASTFHYKQVCKNGVAQYPDEWFPSVSATIGDWMPERGWFQIWIACCSGPRFALVGLQWLKHRTEGKGESAGWLAVIGVVRTFACGGWVFVTSTDHGDFHDTAMILYLLLTLPWMGGSILLTPRKATSYYRKITCATLFFGGLPPMIHFYLQHKVQRIPGAYTYYAFFEWGLILWDVAFDAMSATDFKDFAVNVVHMDPEVTGAPLAAITENDSLTPQKTFFGIRLSETSSSKSGIPETWELPPEQAGWGLASGLEKGDVGIVVGLGAFLSDVYLAMCFWTVFTNLGLQLFYFSVWELSLSGSELFLFTTLSPYLLSRPSTSRLATSRHGQSLLRGVWLAAGLGAYKVPGVFWRLVAVGLANAVAWVEVVGGLGRLRGGVGARSEGIVLMIGLIITLILKLSNYSTNPFWSIVDEQSGGWNKSGVALAAVAWAEKHWRNPRLFVHPAALDHKKDDDAPVPDIRPDNKQPSNLGITIGLGCLIFLVQTLITDAGTVIAWSWTGYPKTGPDLLPFGGGVVILSACLGIMGTLVVPSSMLLSIPWAAIGAVSTTLLVRYQDWTGFIAGCVLVNFLVSLVPPFLQAISASTPSRIGRTFGHAMLINAFLDVVSVLTVAYAFVPGGNLFRERMDVVMWGSLLGVFWGINETSRLLGVSGRKGGETSDTRASIKAREVWSRWFLVLLPVLGFAVNFSVSRRAAKVVPYLSAASRAWTCGIWAVHFGVDIDGRDSQRRMLELVRDMQVDVVGLLETDLHRFVYGNRDLTRMIAEELGYYVDLGPGPNKHTWGAALLSKFPILESEHHLLPSPDGELAPAIYAKLLIHGEPINVIVSHNGQEEDPVDRELQSIAIAKIMSNHYPEPFAFIGYLVTDVGAQKPAPYEIIMRDGRMMDVEIEDRLRWCQYIAFRGMWRVAYARVTHGDITDTELQVARFVLSSPGTPVEYTTNEELYYHTAEENVPQEWRFTRAFRGNGTRGHTYEVFDGPLYYWPPPKYHLGVQLAAGLGPAGETEKSEEAEEEMPNLCPTQ